MVICHREWLIEAGFGQAMYVFENERGKHDTETCWGQFGLKKCTYSCDEGGIHNALIDLVEKHFDQLLRPISWLGLEYGLHTFAIEGYFEPVAQTDPVVVDMDLPLDVAWN